MRVGAENALGTPCAPRARALCLSREGAPVERAVRYIPPEFVRAHVDAVRADLAAHDARHLELVGRHHRLAPFLRHNTKDLPKSVRGIPYYHLGFVAGIFDSAGAGGTMRPQLEVAEIEAIAERVKDTAAQLRPFEPGFADRVRTVAWRAQPCVLDEALDSILEPSRPTGPDEVDATPADRVLIFLMCWIVLRCDAIGCRPTLSCSVSGGRIRVQTKPRRRWLVRRGSPVGVEL
jgi:hypothetical protein